MFKKSKEKIKSQNRQIKIKNKEGIRMNITELKTKI